VARLLAQVQVAQSDGALLVLPVTDTNWRDLDSVFAELAAGQWSLPEVSLYRTSDWPLAFADRGVTHS
jgi:hypothetical protein